MESKQKKPRLAAYELADLNYRYQQLSTDMDKVPRDYGTGELYTPAEVHIVTRIEVNPGTTVTQIAEQTLRTKSAVSQMISKLEAKGLIRREKDPHNAKQQLLYVTAKGLELSKCHKAYDERNMPIEDMSALFGPDAVDKFTELMEFLIERAFEQYQKNKFKK